MNIYLESILQLGQPGSGTSGQHIPLILGRGDYAFASNLLADCLHGIHISGLLLAHHLKYTNKYPLKIIVKRSCLWNLSDCNAVKTLNIEQEGTHMYFTKLTPADSLQYVEVGDTYSCSSQFCQGTAV